MHTLVLSLDLLKPDMEECLADEYDSFVHEQDSVWA